MSEQMVVVKADPEQMERHKKGFDIIKEKQITKYANDGKKKIIKEIHFANGITKSVLIGLMKNKRVIFDRGIDFKKI